MLGHPAVIVKDLGGEATDWRAPDLGCQVLRHRYATIQMNGSFKLEIQERAIQLKIGEPDPTLFEIPSSYISMKPSQAARLEAQRQGIPWRKGMEKAAEREDFLSNGQVVRKPAW